MVLLRKISGSEKTAYQPLVSSPRRPERPGEIGWPSPTPLLMIPKKDLGKTLKQILDRLGGIEKRLEKIEKALLERPHL